MLIDALEVSVAIVALPAVGEDLGIAPHRLHWVVTGFAVGFGALMLFGTRVVALLGRRPVYLAALLVFAAASLASAFADSLVPLVATRLVKGFCAALTAPTGLAIIASVFPEGRPAPRRVGLHPFRRERLLRRSAAVGPAHGSRLALDLRVPPPRWRCCCSCADCG